MCWIASGLHLRNDGRRFALLFIVVLRSRWTVAVIAVTSPPTVIVLTITVLTILIVTALAVLIIIATLTLAVLLAFAVAVPAVLIVFAIPVVTVLATRTAPVAAVFLFTSAPVLVEARDTVFAHHIHELGLFLPRDGRKAGDGVGFAPFAIGLDDLAYLCGGKHDVTHGSPPRSTSLDIR